MTLSEFVDLLKDQIYDDPELGQLDINLDKSCADFDDKELIVKVVLKDD